MTAPLYAMTDAAGKEISKEEAADLIKRRETLLSVVADSYRRMATNKSLLYRREQVEKCEEWLAELTEIHDRSPYLFNISPEKLFDL